MAEKRMSYDNNSISALKGADRVRLRPAVIFGSDGLEGCEHSVFEILSNAVDEAREGYGDRIIITVFADKSAEQNADFRGRSGADRRYRQPHLCTAKNSGCTAFIALCAGYGVGIPAGQEEEYHPGVNPEKKRRRKYL